LQGKPKVDQNRRLAPVTGPNPGAARLQAQFCALRLHNRVLPILRSLQMLPTMPRLIDLSP